MGTPFTGDISTASEHTEICEHAQRIKKFQRQFQLSFTDLAKRFPGVGSDRTYGKLVKGDTSELLVADWVQKYRAIVNTIEVIVGKAGRVEPIYDDLSMAIMIENAYMEVYDEPMPSRFAIGLADSGCGKTMGVRSLVQKYSESVKYFEAVSMWNDRPMRMLTAMLETYGVSNPPQVGHILLRDTKTYLRARPMCVIIDEAHHLGPESLNTIKTLINDTPAAFVALAMPPLWERMAKPAYQEVKQLTGNRLATRFTGGLEMGDIMLLLERRVKWEDPEIVSRVAPTLHDKAAAKGNLSFVRAVVNAITERTEGEPATLDDYSHAVAAKEAQR